MVDGTIGKCRAVTVIKILDVMKLMNLLSLQMSHGT